MRFLYPLFRLLRRLAPVALWAALGCTSLPAQTPPRRQSPAGAVAQVSAPSLLRQAGRLQGILLPIFGPMPQARSHRLGFPRRWYIDLTPAIKDRGRVEFPGGGWFKDIRLAQFQNQPGRQVVRLVLDLPPNGPRPRLLIRQHGFLILPGAVPARKASALRKVRRIASRPPATATPRSSHRVRRIASTARTAAPTTARPSPAVAKTSPKAAAAMPPPPPAPTPATQAVHIPPSLLHPGPLSQASPETPPQYTGERITLRLKNASLKDFFRIIHEVSGLNVIVDSDVNGTVTMMMNDVPWDQAFDLVVQNNGLGYSLEGNVLRISKLSTLINEQKQRRAWAQAEAARSPLDLRMVRLSYISASAVSKTLDHPYILGQRGQLIPNNVSNLAGSLSGGSGGSAGSVEPSTLLVLASKQRMPKILALIKQLDQRRPQIEIEARVVATTRTYARELGVQLAFLTSNAATVAAGDPLVGLSPVGSGIPLNTNLGANAPNSGISIINASKSYELDAILTAAESHGQGRVLSSPRVVTQDNEPAMVQQGVRIPLQTTINNTISVQLFNVTLRLMVTPRVTPDGHIYLTVNVRNESIDAGIPRIQGMPAIDTQSANTRVLVQNGGTAVIGGVIIRNHQNSVFQVPVLGDVPVVGNLFKHTSITSSDQELLFFITPKIVKTT